MLEYEPRVHAPRRHVLRCRHTADAVVPGLPAPVRYTQRRHRTALDAGRGLITSLKQIDAALEFWATHRAKAKYDDLSDLKDRSLHTEVNTILAATLDRLAPAHSQYRESIGHIMSNKVGALRALRRDYDAGYLATVQSLVRAEQVGTMLLGVREFTARVAA